MHPLLRSPRFALALVLFAAVACDEPPPKQPEGERCSMAHGQFDRCMPPLYCSPPTGLRTLFPSKAGPVGLCMRYLKEGEGCARTPAVCEPGLFCEKQAGVCRYSSGVSHEKRGEDIVE